jgi:hypothetical protein
MAQFFFLLLNLGVLGVSDFDQGAINEFNALRTLKSI